MNLNGITSGITRNASKLGLLAGVLTGSSGGFDSFTGSVSNALSGNIHLPDFATMLQQYAYSPNFKTGLMATIGGYIAAEFAPGSFKKYAKLVSDAGAGYLEGSFIHWLLYFATHSNQGSDPTKPGYSPGWNTQAAFKNAPTTQEAVATYGY